METDKINKCNTCGLEGDSSLFCKSGYRCKACANAYNKRWNAANKEKVREYGKKYRAEVNKLVKEKNRYEIAILEAKLKELRE